MVDFWESRLGWNDEHLTIGGFFSAAFSKTSSLQATTPKTCCQPWRAMWRLCSCAASSWACSSGAGNPYLPDLVLRFWLGCAAEEEEGCFFVDRGRWKGSRWRSEPEELRLPPQVDLDFLFWVVKPSNLQDFTQLYTLCNWHHPVNQLPTKGQLVVTELPFQLRLLSWAGKALSFLAGPCQREKRWSRRSSTSSGGRWASAAAVLLLQWRGKPWQPPPCPWPWRGQAGEHLIGLVSLNQKEPVWGKGRLLQGTTLDLLPTWTAGTTFYNDVLQSWERVAMPKGMVDFG